MTKPDRWAYDDLRLRIDRDTDGTYRTLVMAPDGRTARGTFNLPLTDDELDDFVQRVGLVRRRRGPAVDRLGAIKELGSSLFDALFADQVGNVYSAAKAAASDGERRLRITLHLSGAPELMRLPWEFLYQRPRFIAQSSDTPIIRTLDVDSARRPQRLKLPLRILGITSSPVGYQQLDAETERRNLETALEPLCREGLVELSWLNRATLRDLARRISEPDEIHVIHYIGHGAYSESTEAGILVLETPEGRAHDVSGEEIGAMLQDERTLRLVVLNSCDGARTSHIDPFSGVATSLIEFDIPAVVGMQFEITDLAAIAFSETLYAGLAHGMPIDAAVGPARRAIMAMTTAEFGTPVLFLRDGDARLFDIDIDIDIDSLTVTSPEAPAAQAPPVATIADPVVQPPPAASSAVPAAKPSPAASSAVPAAKPPPAATSAVPAAKPPPAATSAVPAAKPPPAATRAVPAAKPPPAATRAVPAAKPPTANKSVPAPKPQSDARGIALWVTAFGFASFGTFLSAVLQGSDERGWVWVWLVIYAATAILGSIAASVSAVRNRILGALLAAASVLTIFLGPSLTNATWDTTLASVLQIVILGVVRVLTKPPEFVPKPRDFKPGSKRRWD